MLHLEKLESKDPKIKYGYAKELTQLASTAPQLLLPYYAEWLKLLHHPNNIIKWTAIDIIGRLSAADSDGSTITALPNIIALLHSGKLITSGHAIAALCMIAKNIPSMKDAILIELFKVAEDVFETTECRNIAIGHVLKGLIDFTPDIKHNTAAKLLIDKAMANSRNATRIKAAKLSKKLAYELHT